MLRGTVVLKILLALGVLSCSALAYAATKPNLILITLDSARADRMGFLGERAKLTPNLDRLAAESLVFAHAYAQAPGTVVSHASILSGAYPQSTEVSEIGGALPASLPYLPDLLRAQGYRTAAFVGSIDLDPRNGPAQGFERGFQTYNAGFRPPIAGDARSPVTSRSASQVLATALSWMARNPKGPMFLWIHFDGPRRPSSYNASITAADAAVGKLVAALKQQKVYANTAILVVADHGESLGAHGEAGHGIFLYDETIHVPLLLKMPEAQTTAKRVATKVRLVDIAPTLLEVAAVPVPSQMQGQSLLRIARASASPDQPVYSRSDFPQRGFGWSPLESWRAGKYLYIRAPKPELYDLAADPTATHNLAATSTATLDTMAGQVDNFDRRFSGDAGKSPSAQLNSTEMQKLASLGYVGLQQSSGKSTTVTGTDPKDKIAVADKVAEATEDLDKGQSDSAIAALTPLVSSEPGIYLTEYTLGAALAQKGQNAEAVKHLHKAIELQPDSAWAHYRMGASLLKTGDFKTAAVHLEIAAGRLAGFAPAHLALAEAYGKLGRAQDAQKERAKTK